MFWRPAAYDNEEVQVIGYFLRRPRDRVWPSTEGFLYSSRCCSILELRLRLALEIILERASSRAREWSDIPDELVSVVWRVRSIARIRDQSVHEFLTTDHASRSKRRKDGQSGDDGP